MKKHCIIAILLALLLYGCARKESNPDAVNFAEAPTIAIEEVETLPSLYVEFNGADPTVDSAFTENGIFILKQDEDYENAFVYFSDVVSGDTYPICAKPNCTHNDYLCNAYLKNASYLYCDGSYLYYFAGNENQFWRMNTDGTDRKMLFTCNEEAESRQGMHVLNAWYLDGKVYFATFGGIMNPLTLEIESGERICVGDLETGEVTVIPIDFSEGASSTLNILGLHGNALLLRRMTGGQEVFGTNNYHETIFLLDLTTYEITVIVEFNWDDNPVIQMVGSNLLYILLDYDPEAPILEHVTWGEVYTDSASNLIVDLETKTGYLQAEAITSYADVSDEFISYFEWNAYRTDCCRMILDLTTGESRPWPESLSTLYSLTRHGDYIYARDRSRNRMKVRILEEDFWKGIPNIYELPDWT